MIWIFSPEKSDGFGRGVFSSCVVVSTRASAVGIPRDIYRIYLYINVLCICTYTIVFFFFFSV
jgi:hypothetical protein